MNKIFIAVAALLLASCGNNSAATITQGYQTRCIDGVEYLVFRAGSDGIFATVKYDIDGKISTCQ